jgi:hypothetical protein
MRRRLWQNTNGAVANDLSGGSTPQSLDEMDRDSLVSLVRRLRQDVAVGTEREACGKKELIRVRSSLEREKVNSADLSDALAAQKVSGCAGTLPARSIATSLSLSLFPQHCFRSKTTILSYPCIASSVQK